MVAIDFEKLRAPFLPEKISWRVGASNKKAWERDNSIQKKGIALAYIDARDVMERLDDVCGFQGWQALYPHANGKTSCKIGIYCQPKPELGGIYEWIWKENGAGDSDVEAEKGAFSDSFKRAAVLWGIGRYLYDMPNVWVELNDRWQIQDAEIKNKLFPALLKLSQGIIPKIEENPFTPENKSIQAEIITKIGIAKDLTELDSVIDEHTGDIERLPEEMNALINAQKEIREGQIQSGINPTITSHKYASVDDQRAWVKRMLPVVKGFKSIAALEAWKAYNAPFISGLADKGTKTAPIAPRAFFLEELDKRANELTVKDASAPIG